MVMVMVVGTIMVGVGIIVVIIIMGDVAAVEIPTTPVGLTIPRLIGVCLQVQAFVI